MKPINLNFDSPRFVGVASILLVVLGYILQDYTETVRVSFFWILMGVIITSIFTSESLWDWLKYQTPKFVADDIHGTILQEEIFGKFSVFRLGGVKIRGVKLPFGRDKEKTVIVPSDSVIRLGESYISTVKLHPEREITGMPPSLMDDLRGLGFKFDQTVYFGTLEQGQMTERNKKLEDIFYYHNMLINLDSAGIKSQSEIVKRYLASYQMMENVMNQSLKSFLLDCLISIRDYIKKIEPRFWLYAILFILFFIYRDSFIKINMAQSWFITIIGIISLTTMYFSMFFVYERSSQFVSNKVFGCLRNPVIYGNFTMFLLDVPDYLMSSGVPKRIAISKTSYVRKLGSNYASGGYFKRISYKDLMKIINNYEEYNITEEEVIDLIDLIKRNKKLLKKLPIWIATNGVSLTNHYEPIITPRMLLELGVPNVEEQDLEEVVKRIHEQYRDRIKEIAQAQKYTSENLKSKPNIPIYPLPEEEERK